MAKGMFIIKHGQHSICINTNPTKLLWPFLLQTYGTTGLLAAPAAPQATAAAAVVAAGTQLAASQQLLGLMPAIQQVYDPMAMQSIPKINNIYVQQQQGPLLGTFLQRPGP
jgi:hypothetical protein